MKCIRPVVLVLLTMTLAACGPDTGDTTAGSGGGGSSAGGGGDAGGDGGAGGSPTAPVVYRVPDDECPSDYPYGLTITTDVEAEVEYLKHMPACTNGAATAMWLRNDTDAVWELQSRSGSSGQVTRLDETLRQVSFMDAVGSSLPLLMPKGNVSVNVPPEDVNWSISLDYTLGWAAHDLAVERVASAGETAAVAALRRRSPAGAAVAACALAGVEGAKTVSHLEEADSREVMIEVLGSSVAGLKCRTEAQRVRTFNPDGTPAVLSDELSHLGANTELIEKVHTRMDFAQRAFKALTFGLKFWHRG